MKRIHESLESMLARHKSYTAEERFAYACTVGSVYEFMILLFPESWWPIAARIAETGAEFGPEDSPWAPRWGKIPCTEKKGRTPLEASLKTCLYRVHDCFHQLWGLPVPQDRSFDEDQFYIFKRAQMCGEVAVLTISELLLAKHLYDAYPEVRRFIARRCGVEMLEGPLNGKTLQELAVRMDGLLHKKVYPRWVRDHEPSKKFCDYYVPMLEADRFQVNHNWACMRDANWLPQGVPNSRYSKDLDGLELTLWMVNDFAHLSKTDATVDWDLAEFNRERRSKVEFPAGWGEGFAERLTASRLIADKQDKKQ